MNDSRRGSADGPRRAIAADAAFAPLAPSVVRAAPADPLVLSHREKRLIAISMMLPVFLGSVDQSVLASALPTIGRDLGEVHNLPWLITAFLIASTALTPLYGKFADIRGRRAAMLIGLVVYMVGSLLCAASPNMLTLICSRVVQGCGAGGLVVTANMVLGDIAAPRAGLHIFFHSIHDRGRQRAGAGRMDCRAPALADDLFVEFSVMRRRHRDRAHCAAPLAAP